MVEFSLFFFKKINEIPSIKLNHFRIITRNAKTEYLSIGEPMIVKLAILSKAFFFLIKKVTVS